MLFEVFSVVCNQHTHVLSHKTNCLLWVLSGSLESLSTLIRLKPLPATMTSLAENSPHQQRNTYNYKLYSFTLRHCGNS